MEVFFAGEARNFFGRNILDELSRAAVVSRKRSAGIFKKQERKSVGNDLGVIPTADIVRVLLANDAFVGRPFTDHVRTVANVGLRLDCPCIAVCGDGSFVDRAEGSECGELIKVRAGISENDGKSFAVFACLNV